MKNNLISLIYVVLSNLFDFYIFGFCFRNITKVRAKVLNLLPSFNIQENIQKYI
jgi:hypothetical protein